MTAEDVVKLLLGALAVAGSVIAFLFYRIEKATNDRDQARKDCEEETKALNERHAEETRTLHEAHKAEMRENGKALMGVTEKLVSLAERRRP